MKSVVTSSIPKSRNKGEEVAAKDEKFDKEPVAEIEASKKANPKGIYYYLVFSFKIFKEKLRIN
jgi:hypothetical protein